MEPTKVGRVVVRLLEEPREFTDCWVVVDHAQHLLHIWLDPRKAQPDVTAPLQYCLIEWGRMPARPKNS